MTDERDLVNTIIDLHRRVNRALRQYVPEAWMGLKLTIGQLKSLFYISNEGSTNSRKLAAALRVTPSNVTGIVDRLVEQGLVSRHENPEDRRTLLLQTTEKGESVLADLRERRITHLSEALAALVPEDLATLAQGLAALAAAVEEPREGGER